MATTSSYPQPNPMTSSDAFFAKIDADAAAAANAIVDNDAAAAAGRAIAAEPAVPRIHAILRASTVDMAALREELDMVNVNVRSPRGKTPLMAAAYYGHRQAIALLIERGAVVDAIHEKSGDTASHFVCMSLVGNVRQSGCIMALIEGGASIDSRNDDGYTVFELAKKNGNREIGATGDALMHS